MLAGLKTGKSGLSSRLGPAPRGLSGVLRPGGPWRGGRDHSSPKVEAPSSFCRILRVLESWKGRFSVPGPSQNWKQYYRVLEQENLWFKGSWYFEAKGARKALHLSVSLSENSECRP